MNMKKTIKFSGFKWEVGNGYSGPGPNHWSNSQDSVWVDEKRALHLKIRKIDDKWYSASVNLEESLGYGEYTFYLQGHVENFSPNIIVGLFTYESDKREIDIEFTRWGHKQFPNGWYTVQPFPYFFGNQNKFRFALNSKDSVHKFIWNKNKIVFKSYIGQDPSDDSKIINKWTYKGKKIPPQGKEKLYINFWLFRGKAPLNNKEEELIIKRVEFKEL